jgi:hypothetical protein
MLVASVTDAQTSSGTLTGKMAPFSYLLGTAWTCNVSVPAMMGEPAHTEKGTVTFDTVASNTMHVHISTTSFVGDQYFGYSTRRNMYWSTSANSEGEALMQTSSDGKNYVGSVPMGSTMLSVHDTYSKLTDTHMTFVETATQSGQNYVTNGDCTR